MTIQWGSLLAVFVVSLSSTVAVVVLVSLAMLGLSVRAVPTAVPPRVPTRPPVFSPAVGTAVAAACLAAAALIVLFGLWALIAR
jgi:hypothetical protein